MRRMILVGLVVLSLAGCRREARPPLSPEEEKLRASPTFKQALGLAAQSEQVRDLLGSPLQVEKVAQTSRQGKAGDVSTRMTIRVSGPKGAGTIHSNRWGPDDGPKASSGHVVRFVADGGREIELHRVVKYEKDRDKDKDGKTR